MTDTTIQRLAKAFRDTADARIPTTQQPMAQMPRELQNQAFSFQVSPERDQQEKIVWSVLSAIASAFERAAKEVEER